MSIFVVVVWLWGPLASSLNSSFVTWFWAIATSMRPARAEARALGQLLGLPEPALPLVDRPLQRRLEPSPGTVDGPLGQALGLPEPALPKVDSPTQRRLEPSLEAALDPVDGPLHSPLDPVPYSGGIFNAGVTCSGDI